MKHIDVDDNTHREIKILSARLGLSIGDIIKQILNYFLITKDADKEKKS